MSGLETAAIALGAAVAKTACGVWLGPVAEVGNSMIDLAARRLATAREQRQFRRVWDQAAELIAEQVEPLVEREFRDVPDHERVAALEAVRDTFDAAGLSEEELLKQDLDAGFLDRLLRDTDPDRVDRAGLSDGARRLYDLVLHECCAYAIELAGTLPGSGMAALTELLRRDREILDDLAAVLARLPALRGLADFERDYRQLVGNRLDQVEFFGATLAETHRRYPLSVAYLSLNVAGRLGQKNPASTRVDEILARSHRVFVRGQAGLGKTTLLQWIAVQCARRSFGPHLAEWNDTVPFLVPLRRYATADLPTPEMFIREIGRHLAEEMPGGWVHEQLRSGRAVVLVDGIDELADERRADARQWLSELVDLFPDARYVVTSRPAAVPPDWLGSEQFYVAELEPMGRADIPVFIQRWHQAMRTQCRSAEEHDEIAGYEQSLIQAIDRHRPLRQLAGYPLLSALLCALHRDRRAQLPRDRLELYEVALHMLLERRDVERHIESLLALTRTEKTLLVQDLAYWLIRNEWSDASCDDIVARLDVRLRTMPQVKARAEDVYRVLLERSGLLREPVEGRADFVHRTFQEYLAAKQATDDGDIGVLVSHAHLDQWQEVVVMAAGHATSAARTTLLDGLLKRINVGSEEGSERDTVRLVALACLETSPDRAPELDEAIRNATEVLVPPRSREAVTAIGRAGSFALDLLAPTDPQTVDEVVYTIQAAVATGDHTALPILARFGKRPEPAIVDALVEAWSQFDAEEYADAVLRHSPLHGGRLEITDSRLLPSLRRLERLAELRYRARWPDDPEAVNLDFARSLPRLRRLAVPMCTDLKPLAGLGLDRLTIEFLGGHHDLSPLAAVPTLQCLSIGGPVVFADALRHLSKLCDLTLDTTAVEYLARGRYSPSLGRLRLLGPMTVDSLDFLGRWSSSLTALDLDPDTLELAPLTRLTSVVDLTLRLKGLRDLSPLAGMATLQRLNLVYTDLPDELTLG